MGWVVLPFLCSQQQLKLCGGVPCESYGSIGRVTSCTLRLERLADLAAEAAVAAEEAGRHDEQRRRQALESQASSAKRVKEDGGGAELTKQELAIAIAGQAVEFKVQVAPPCAVSLVMRCGNAQVLLPPGCYVTHLFRAQRCLTSSHRKGILRTLPDCGGDHRVAGVADQTPRPCRHGA